MIPFIIEDVTPRAERLPRETAHANGVTGIERISVATSDVARFAGVMTTVTGVVGETLRDEELSASGLRLTVGEHALEYLSPDNGRGSAGGASGGESSGALSRALQNDW